MTARGEDVLQRIDIIRVNDQVLRVAGTMTPVEVRSLDAIHLATVTLLGADGARLCTDDERMNAAAAGLGCRCRTGLTLYRGRCKRLFARPQARVAACRKRVELVVPVVRILVGFEVFQKALVGNASV